MTQEADQFESPLRVTAEDADSVKPPALDAGVLLLERFEISRLLGHGGMGEVYAGYDRESRENVAIKMVRSTLAENPDYIKQLRHEIQIARRIHHPNVCRLFDLHRAMAADGKELVFLTMEFIEGPTLQDRIDGSGPLAPDEVRMLAGQLAAGLEAIHQAGIVHRDLKSHNILLSKTARGAVILDFGLARQENVLNSLSIFGSKAIVGTPVFMPPEQLRGEASSAESDIYALGAVLYHALTGKLPFDGESMLAIAVQKLDAPPPRLRTAAPQLATVWDRAVSSCLQVNPHDRPSSANAVLDIIDGKSKGTVRLSRRAMVLGGTAALALSGVTYFAVTRPHVAPPQAQIKFKQAEEFAKRRSRENLLAAISGYQDAVKIDPKYADAWAGLAQAYSTAANFVYMEPRQARSQAASAAATALALNSHLARARIIQTSLRSIDFQHWREADGMFRELADSYPENPQIHIAYATYLGRAGRFDDAIRQAQRAVALDPASLSANGQLAEEFFRGGRLKMFLTQAREVVRLQDFEQTGHLQLARALEWNGDLSAARHELELAKLYGAEDSVNCFEATLLVAEGRREEAVTLGQKIRHLAQQQFIETNAMVGVFAALKDTDQVLEILEEGYKKGDATVLAAATNPYMKKLGPDPKIRAFFQRLGF